MASQTPTTALRAAALLVVLSASTSSLASPSSEVVSAFVDEGGIEIHARVDYDLSIRRAAIKRELAGLESVQPGDPLPIAKDLVYQGTRHTLTPRVDVGVFQDLSLSLALPIVIYDSRSLDFDQRSSPCVFAGQGSAATCIDAQNSTTVRDGILPPTGFDSDDPGGPGFTSGSTIFRGPNRSGLDQVHLGVTFAAMNQERDDTKPTWKLGAELRLSVGSIMRFDLVDPSSETGVSRGVHELYAWTSMARRLDFVEPRFELWYLAPIAQRDGSLFQDLGYGQTSAGPQHRAGTRFGAEAILWSSPEDQQRVALDLGAEISAFFEGRAYTEMWEVIALAGNAATDGPLVLDRDPTEAGVQAASHPGVTNVENHLQFASKLGVAAELGPRVRIGASFQLVFDQQHLITFADAGRDGTDPGDLVDAGTAEVNPAYRDIIDLAGRRYRLDEAMSYVTLVTGRVLF